MATPDLDHEPDFVASFDGTLLAGRKMGSGEKAPLLVCNAVGANLASWRKVLVDVARERPIVSWDLRGLGESQAPISERIDPGAHAEDAIAVLDHYGLDKFVVASWSNGARIALELAHRYPESVAALSIVSGGYGHALGRLFRLEIASVLPTIAGVAKHFASFLEGPFRSFTTRPEFAGLIRQSGLIGATADTGSMVDLLKGMASCDGRTFLAMYEAIAGDAAPDLLDDVSAPTLIVVGERDPFTPRAVSEQMAERIPGARLLVYERATHYLPIEFPAKLSDDLRAFWSENRL